MSIKRFVKAYFPFIFNGLKKIQQKYYVYLGKHNPRLLIEKLYYNFYHRKINLENPKDIDEKVNYLKLYGDTKLWSLCADKYEVRKYVEKLGLGHTLNEVYGVYNSPEEINIDSLPDSFVIKTTNGGGGNSVMIVSDKSSFNYKQAVKTLRKWMKIPMGYKYGEKHYNSIKPRLIVEKLLSQGNGGKSLIDYKFHCFDGKAYSIDILYDREFGKQVFTMVYDLEWNAHPETLCTKYGVELKSSKPKSLDDMIKYSEILSKGIPYVRVDWYEIEGKPVFGEMTFTPCGGFQTDYTRKFLEELGDQMDISTIIKNNDRK